MIYFFISYSFFLSLAYIGLLKQRREVHEELKDLLAKHLKFQQELYKLKEDYEMMSEVASTALRTLNRPLSDCEACNGTGVFLTAPDFKLSPCRACGLGSKEG